MSNEKVEIVRSACEALSRGRDGIEVRARIAMVWTIHNGAVTRATLYQELQEALEDAGLSE